MMESVKMLSIPVFRVGCSVLLSVYSCSWAQSGPYIMISSITPAMELHEAQSCISNLYEAEALSIASTDGSRADHDAS